jgi:hypothetical protein
MSDDRTARYSDECNALVAALDVDTSNAVAALAGLDSESLEALEDGALLLAELARAQRGTPR